MSKNTIPFIVVSVLFGICVLAGQYSVSRRHMESRVRSFALTHFDAIDSNSDGMIIDGELQQAAASLPLKGEERNMLAYLSAQRSTFGHPIRCSKEASVISIYNGQTGPAVAMIRTACNYGISRKNLL
jgi:hypothetical protein